MVFDPLHFFNTVAGAPNSSVAGRLEWMMLNEWARRDLYAAVEALRNSDHPGIRSMRMNIVGRVIEKDAELGLKLFHEWGIEAYRPHMDAVEKCPGRHQARGGIRSGASGGCRHGDCGRADWQDLVRVRSGGRPRFRRGIAEPLHLRDR